MIGKDKGFSLIEVVIAMSLFSIVLLAGYQLLFSGLKSWIHGEEQIDVVQNMRVAMDLMTKEIRTATKVKIDENDSSKIEFTLPNGKIIRYRLDSSDKELEKQEDANSFQPFASRISGVSFSTEPENNPINWVEITLIGQRKDGHEITLKSKVTLRSVR